MNLKLYGICFKMRGGPDLLDYVQDDRPVPVDVMGQVMAQMNSITDEEMAFAERLDADWKAAFSERVPLLMGIGSDGGYDISCDVPDELLRTVHVLHGLSNEKIVEEYVTAHLRTVCGVDTTIISVDAEKEDASAAVKQVESQGFDLDDLGAMPDALPFEDVSEFGDVAEEIATVQDPAAGSDYKEPEQEEVALEEPSYEEMDVPIEEGYPEEGEFPDMGEEEYPEEAEPEEEYESGAYETSGFPEEAVEEDVVDDPNYPSAMVGIYTELVENIREKRLDERLGLRIGQ